MCTTTTKSSPNGQPNVINEATPLILSNDSSNECQKDDERINEWSLTTVALAFSLLAHSFLLVSVFPYSGFLAMHLIPGLTEETAGSYAGLIGASFMAGRTLSSFEWGKAADRYGRVSVIKLSLLLSAVVSVLFGLAPTFHWALALRFLLGMCNGFIGPVKTLVSEYARGDEALETRMMGLVIGMWAYGFLINPAISGYLSDPVKQYPDAEVVEIFRPTLEEYPFLVPNLVGCVYCILAYILAHFFMEETIPEEKRQQLGLGSILPSIKKKSNEIIRNVSSWGLFKHLHDAEGEVSHHMVLALPPSIAKNGIGSNDDKGKVTISSLWKRESIRQHLLVYWIFSFLMITIDETFPLYCMSRTSGLGIPEKLIGNILSGTGLLYIIMQYFLLTVMVDKFGVYPAMKVGIFGSVPTAILVPLSLLTNKDAMDGTLNLTTLFFLSAVYAAIRAFSAVVFSSITITINRTVPSHQRGTLNGLSMLGGSLAKGLGPLFGGILFSTCVNNVTPPFGSVLVYGILAILGIWMSIYSCVLGKYDTTGASSPTISNKDDEDLQHHQEDEEEEDSPPSF